MEDWIRHEGDFLPNEVMQVEGVKEGNRQASFPRWRWFGRSTRRLCEASGTSPDIWVAAAEAKHRSAEGVLWEEVASLPGPSPCSRHVPRAACVQPSPERCGGAVSKTRDRQTRPRTQNRKSGVGVAGDRKWSRAGGQSGPLTQPHEVR